MSNGQQNGPMCSHGQPTDEYCVTCRQSPINRESVRLQVDLLRDNLRTLQSTVRRMELLLAEIEDIVE